MGDHEQELERLAADARYAREKLALYRAKAYGMRPMSETRLRELERASLQADERLAAARAATP